MTLSPQAALSILIPINIEPTLASHDSPTSISSPSTISIQSDDENDRELASKRQSKYLPSTPDTSTISAVIRPQFSCPDFAMGTARSMKTRMKDTSPVPAVPSIPAHLQRDTSHHDINLLLKTGHKIRKQNSFVQLGVEKRTYEDTFGHQPPSPRKRQGTFLRRLQGRLEPPPNPHRRSRYLTSFDELFKPDLPSSQLYPFKEPADDDSLREKIRQGMEDSIIPSVAGTPIKTERIPLRERIRGLMNSERPKRRKRGWMERIVGKKRNKSGKEGKEVLGL